MTVPASVDLYQRIRSDLTYPNLKNITFEDKSDLYDCYYVSFDMLANGGYGGIGRIFTKEDLLSIAKASTENKLMPSQIYFVIRNDFVSNDFDLNRDWAEVLGSSAGKIRIDNTDI